MINGKPVIFFFEASNNGCNYYRLKQPYDQLTESKHFMCGSNRSIDEKDLDMWVDMADIIVSKSMESELFHEFLKKDRDKKKFVFDVDDNVFAVSPFNPSYEKHGTEEVDLQYGEKSFNIRDGKNGFDLKANMERMSRCAESLKLAHMIITPSSVLSGYIRARFNKNTVVIKNKINPEIWYPIQMQKDDWIRIGWQGGWSHYEDFYILEPIMAKIMEKFKNVRFVVMGTPFPGLVKTLPADRVDFVDWVSMEAYPWKFKTLNIDIGVAPLENNVFNTCKSELKWEEYGALGIPCVASNIPPYSLAIAHEEDGFLAQDENEWSSYLEDLILSKELRQKIGWNAEHKILKDYSVDSIEAQYRSAFNTLIGRGVVTAHP